MRGPVGVSLPRQNRGASLFVIHEVIGLKENFTVRTVEHLPVYAEKIERYSE